MTASSGPFQVTLNATVVLTNPGRFGDTNNPAPELVNLISRLISQHAEEGGFRLVGPQSLEVSVVPREGPIS